MFKKITILLLIIISLNSCGKKEEENVNIDNLNNGVIIDSENKVDELGIGGKGDSSTLEVNGGFNN